MSGDKERGDLTYHTTPNAPYPIGLSGVSEAYATGLMMDPDTGIAKSPTCWLLVTLGLEEEL